MRLRSLALVVTLSAAACDSQRNDSVRLSNEAVKAYGQQAFDEAIEKFTKAIERWRDNHTAYYGLAAAYAKKKDWKHAAENGSKAVQLEPDFAMYNLQYGWYLLEEAKWEATTMQAAREGVKPDAVEVDWSKVNFEKSLQYLQTAVKLNNELWRGYHLIGVIYKHQGKVKESAEAFTKALQLGAHEAAPWIELAELYRAWDYVDESIKVAEQAALVVPEGDRSVIWYEIGVGYDAKQNNDKAIQAFDKALETKRDNTLAKFARGQSYFRKSDWTNAKRDLEEFAKAGGTSLEFFKQQASRMLMEITAKTAPPGSAPTTAGDKKLSPEELVKQQPPKKK